MQLGVRAHDLQSENLENLVELCEKYDIDGLQLVISKLFNIDITNSDKVEELINRFKENDIEIYLLGCYINLIHPDDDVLKNEIKKMKKNIEIANKFNITYIGTETGSINVDDWSYNKQNHELESLTKVFKSISYIKSGSYDIEKKLLVEPVYNQVLYNIEKVDRFIIETNLNIIFDIVNVLNISNYKEWETIFVEYITRHKSNIKLLHFKNFTIENDEIKLCGLDKGFIDYRKIIKILYDNELDSCPIIVEELQGKELIESIKYLREINSDYKILQHSSE